jgi:hypothetical protein
MEIRGAIVGNFLPGLFTAAGVALVTKPEGHPRTGSREP